MLGYTYWISLPLLSKVCFAVECQNLIYLVDRHRLSTGGNEKIQLTALLSAFKGAVELTAKGSA